MIKICIVLIFVLCCFENLSVNNAQNDNTELCKWEQRNKKGDLIAEVNCIDDTTKLFTVYWSFNGQIRQIKTYINNLAEGPYKIYHINGALSSAGQYKKGMLTGWRIINNYHGVTVRKTYSSNDTLIRIIYKDSGEFFACDTIIYDVNSLDNKYILRDSLRLDGFVKVQ